MLNSTKSKSRNMIHVTLYVENTMYRVRDERSNIVAFFTEHVKFSELTSLGYEI